VSEKLGHGRQAIAHTLALPRPFGPYQNVSRETFLSDSSPKPYKAENSGFSVNLVRSIDFLVRLESRAITDSVAEHFAKSHLIPAALAFDSAGLRKQALV
jgi:hypothetical protein